MVDTSGLNVYRVGGAVRDEQLNREPNDEDFVVVGATPEEMIHRGFNQPVGESFAVFIHPETGDEWALARTKESDGEGSGMTADPSVTLHEDLYRRDLTINAMAEDTDTGELIDPYGGLDDLEQSVLRHVSPAFADDPLRVLRVATFSARLPEFTIHEETKDLCRDLVPQLADIAPNRVRSELIKMFQKAEEPRRFFDVLNKFNALETVFPLLAELTEIRAGPKKHHKEGFAFEHTMRVLSEAKSLDEDNERLLWAALGHDLGKAYTSEADQPKHPRHEKVGPDAVSEFAENIKLGDERSLVMADAARYHMRFHKATELNPATLIRTVDHFGKPNLTVDEFINLGIADGRGREPQKIRTSPEEVRSRLEVAKDAIESFGGEEAFNKFDLEPSDGEKIGNLILQERIKLVKNELN